MCHSANLKSTNRKSTSFPDVPVRKLKIRKLTRKMAVFLTQIHNGLALNVFFYQTTKCHVTMSQNYLLKPKVVLKFEWKHFKLIFVRRKVCICGFMEVLSPPKITGSANSKSSNCLICGRSANLRICDLRNLIADQPTFAITYSCCTVPGPAILSLCFFIMRLNLSLQNEVLFRDESPHL